MNAIDTNVLVYSFDTDDPVRQQKAIELIDQLRDSAMAILSVRMRDDLKRKAQQLAKEQGVSLNGFINATTAEQQTPTFFSDRLKDVD